MADVKLKSNNLAQALVQFQSEVPVIAKTQTAKIVLKTGGSYAYSYAGLAEIWESIRKPLKDNGLAVTQMLKSSDTTDFISTKIWHLSGETESNDFAIPTGGKTPQEVGSVITYYKRYALGAALGISTEEDDDGKSGNKKPEPKTVVTKTGANTEQEAEIRRIAGELGYSNVIVNAKLKTYRDEKDAATAIEVLTQLLEAKTADEKSTADFESNM